MHRLGLMIATCIAASGVAIASPVAAADINPFGVAPVSSDELSVARGGDGLTRSAVQRLVRDQLESFDRQTGQINVVSFDTWSFEVAMPLIAANLGR